MKRILRIIFWSVCLTIPSVYLNAQSFSVLQSEVSNNSEQISLVLKFENEKFQKEKLSLFLNQTPRTFFVDTLSENTFFSSTDVMFVINDALFSDSLFERNFSPILQIFNAPNSLNIGVFNNETTSVRPPVYASPVFSSDTAYFSTFLHQIRPKPHSTSITFCSFLQHITTQFADSKTTISRKALIFITDSISVDNFKASCYDEFRINDLPIYFFVTEHLSETSEKSLIELCTNSGGRYVFGKIEDMNSILTDYMTDIALQKQSIDNSLKTIVVNNTNRLMLNNRLLLIYGQDSVEYNFVQKTQQKTGTHTNLFLLILFGLLVLVFISLIWRGVKRGKTQISVTKTPNNAVLAKKANIFAEFYVINKEITKRYILTAHTTTIGRSAENSITIPDTTISQIHAQITFENDIYYIEDLNSTNGTLLNGKRIQEKSRLKDKDFIQFGISSARFTYAQ